MNEFIFLVAWFLAGFVNGGWYGVAMVAVL